ncbi:3-oxoacyl-ACP reductase [Flavobacterium sp. GNP001]
MKKAILVSGLFSLVMVLTSFTSNAEVSNLSEIEKNGTIELTGNQSAGGNKKLDLTGNQSAGGNKKLDLTGNQSAGGNKKLD